MEQDMSPRSMTVLSWPGVGGEGALFIRDLPYAMLWVGPVAYFR